MADSPGATLSVATLFAERDGRQRLDQEAAEQLQLRKEEELAAFRQRLDNFQLTDAIIKSGLDASGALRARRERADVCLIPLRLLHRWRPSGGQRRRTGD